MTYFPQKALSAIALIAGIGMATWSPASYACAGEPLIGSVCIMAITPTGRFQGNINNTYMLAAGQSLSIRDYTALYSLLGTTFGGDAVNTFNVPDLRGKVVVGYDAGDATRKVGAKGGSVAVNLTVAQLPPHAMTITNLPVAMNNVQASTTLSGLVATANLSGMTIKGAASGLAIKAATTAGGQPSPAGNYLGKAASSGGNIYSNAATPDVALNAGSIAGELNLTVNQGTTAPVSIGGGASTTLSGAGSASGTTGITGAGMAVPVMPPYLVLPYYIAFLGQYPMGE